VATATTGGQAANCNIMLIENILVQQPDDVLAAMARLQRYRRIVIVVSIGREAYGKIKKSIMVTIEITVEAENRFFSKRDYMYQRVY